MAAPIRLAVIPRIGVSIGTVSLNGAAFAFPKISAGWWNDWVPVVPSVGVRLKKLHGYGAGNSCLRGADFRPAQTRPALAFRVRRQTDPGS